MLVEFKCHFVIIFSIRLMLIKKPEINKIKIDYIKKYKTRKFFQQGKHLKRKAKQLHKCSNILKLRLFPQKEGTVFADIVFLFQSYYLESTCTAAYISPYKCTMREKNICLKGLGTVVQIAKPSSRFPTTAGCFFVLHLLVNSVIIMVIAKTA